MTAPSCERRALTALTGQVGGADDTGVLAELRDLDLRQRPVAAAGQRALERGPGGIEQQVARLGHAAADDEAARIEDRGQVGQPTSTPMASVTDRFPRGLTRRRRGVMTRPVRLNGFDLGS